MNQRFGGQARQNNGTTEIQIKASPPHDNKATDGIKNTPPKSDVEGTENDTDDSTESGVSSSATSYGEVFVNPMRGQTDSAVEQKDSVVEQKDSVVEQKDSAVEQKDSVAEHKDSVVKQKVEQKDSVVKQKDKQKARVVEESCQIETYLPCEGLPQDNKLPGVNNDDDIIPNYQKNSTPGNSGRAAMKSQLVDTVHQLMDLKSNTHAQNLNAVNQGVKKSKAEGTQEIDYSFNIISLTDRTHIPPMESSESEDKIELPYLTVVKGLYRATHYNQVGKNIPYLIQ